MPPAVLRQAPINGRTMGDHRSGMTPDMTELDIPVVGTERLILRGFRD